jgi:hypothetical protein
MFALGAFANMSFAENNPTTGTLADGFIGIGNVDTARTNPYYYKLTVNGGDISTVPVPASILLFATGLAGFAARKKPENPT